MADVGGLRAHLAAIRPDADLTEADWWETSWPDDVATPPAVGFLVPRGFEAYARILHPAEQDGHDVRWAEVADACGTTLHPEAQWHRLAGGRDLDPRGRAAEPVRWSGNDPHVGLLGRPQVEALADVLARHTASAGHTVVAFWVGYGLWPHAWHDLPTTPRPVRESYLFRRPLRDVEALCAEAPAVAYALGETRDTRTWGSDGSVAAPSADELLATWGSQMWQSPSAWWPADHAWVTSNDTDLDSTLVGGTRALVDDLLADARLEVLPWHTDGSLWSGADTLNS